MTTETTEKQSWLQRNQKAVIIVSLVVIAGLLLLPDAMIRKYVPWVK